MAAAIPRATSESLPDFVKLAEAFGAVGLRCHEPAKLDDVDQGDDRRSSGR